VKAERDVEGELVDLCHIDELPVGLARGFDLRGKGRDSLFVVRRDDTLRGYFNLCPHQGASLPWQKDKYLSADGAHIVCHAHGAQFDIDSGVCLLGPALGERLFPVDLTVKGDGTVQARVGRTKGGEN